MVMMITMIMVRIVMMMVRVVRNPMNMMNMFMGIMMMTWPGARCRPKLTQGAARAFHLKTIAILCKSMQVFNDNINRILFAQN